MPEELFKPRAGVATELYVQSQIEAVDPDNEIGPLPGYLTADSPVTSLGGQRNSYFTIWEAATVDGTAYSAKTVIKYHTDGAAGDATKYSIDQRRTESLRAAVSLKTVTIDPVAGDDNISAAEAQSNVGIILTFTNVADNTPVTLLITDANGSTVTKVPVVTSNSATPFMTPDDMAGLVGPLTLQVTLTGADPASRVVTLDVPVFIVNDVGDNVFTVEEQQSPIDITGKAVPSANVAASGAYASNRTVNASGDFVFTLSEAQIATLPADTDFDIDFDTPGQPTITKTFHRLTAATVAVVPTGIAAPQINPAQPEAADVTVQAAGEQGQVVRLRATRNGDELWSLTQNNNAGAAANFQVPSANVGQMVAPSRWEARTELDGVVSTWFPIDAVYQVVNDPVTGDPLPSETFTASFPENFENWQRQNVNGRSLAMVYDDGGTLKQLTGWLSHERKWKVGERVFPTGDIVESADVSNFISTNPEYDNHNGIAVLIDPAFNDKFMFADMHVDPTRAAKTNAAGNWVDMPPSDFPDADNDRWTYPEGFILNNKAFLSVREQEVGGGNPRFRWIIEAYAAGGSKGTGTWSTRLSMNTGDDLRLYVSGMAVSADGTRAGCAAIWRDDDKDPNGTNQQRGLLFLYTDDEFNTMRHRDGSVQPMSIWYDNGRGNGSNIIPNGQYLIPPTAARIPNKPGTVVFDENKRAHVVTEIKNEGLVYFRDTGTGWEERALPFDESSSVLTYYGGRVGLIVHRSGKIYYHPIEDVNDPDHNNGVEIGSGVGGAYIMNIDREAEKLGYVDFIQTVNQSHSPGTQGSYKQPATRKTVPYTQLGVENTDISTLRLVVDPIAGDGVVDDTEAASPITVMGSVNEPATISFVAEFSIAPITLTEPGVFESSDIVADILEQRSGEIEVIATTPDGRITSQFETFAVPSGPVSIPAYEPVDGISIINKDEGLAGHIFVGLAPGSNGKTATITHSLATVAIPEYVVADGKYNIELPAAEIAKTEPGTTYTITADVDGVIATIEYQYHNRTFANSGTHTQYTPGQPLSVTSTTASNKGPWIFRLHITDLSNNKLWPVNDAYREISSNTKDDVQFDIQDTTGWPQTIRFHRYNENVYRNGQTDTQDVTAGDTLNFDLNQPDVAFGGINVASDLDLIMGGDVRYVTEPEDFALGTFESRRALRIRVIPNSGGSEHPQASVRLATPAMKVYMSQDWFFETGWEGGTSNAGAKVGIGFRSDKSVSGSSTDTDGFSEHTMLRHSGNRNNMTSDWYLESYLYNSNRPGLVNETYSYGWSQRWEGYVPIIGGWINKVEKILTMNSQPHLADGELEVWVNGVKVQHLTGIQWQAGGVFGIADSELKVFHGGSDSGWSPSGNTFMLISNVVIRVIDQ